MSQKFLFHCTPTDILRHLSVKYFTIIYLQVSVWRSTGPPLFPLCYWTQTRSSCTDSVGRGLSWSQISHQHRSSVSAPVLTPHPQHLRVHRAPCTPPPAGKQHVLAAPSSGQMNLGLGFSCGHSVVYQWLSREMFEDMENQCGWLWWWSECCLTGYANCINGIVTATRTLYIAASTQADLWPPAPEGMESCCWVGCNNYGAIGIFLPCNNINSGCHPLLNI